mgnify:CR=1 FL=1
MKAYHFIPAKYGLENLKHKRLKIATIPDLNDPFELLCLDLTDKELRIGIMAWKREMANKFGLLCFSRTWRNPVQWSHYADKHRGLCLCFEISDGIAQPVVYSAKRSIEEAKQLLCTGTSDEEMIKKFLTTKYSHWRYEQEVRVFARLEELDPNKEMYFCDFSDSLKLVEVIIGAESTVTRKQIIETLGSMSSIVELRNARLAFKSYRVTTQRDKKLWT